MDLPTTDSFSATRTIDESVESYRMLLGHLPIGVVISTMQGTILDANETMFRMFGCDTKEAFIKRGALHFWLNPEEDRKDFINRLLQGTLVDFEAQFRRDDGCVLWGSLNSRICEGSDGRFVLSLFRDITKQRDAESALQRSEKRFRQVVEHIHDALFTDDIHGTITFANDQFLRLFGFNRAQLPFIKLENYVAPEWREKLRERHSNRILGKKVPARFEYEGVRQDGKRLWLEVDVVPLIDESGRTVGTQSAVRDITAQKHAAEQLRQAEKMEAIGQLAGGLAHDFNNRLVTIQGFAELLEEELEDSTRKDYAKRILNGARRAAKLTGQMLDFARKGDYRVAVVDIHTLIAETVSFLEHSIDKSIQVWQHLNAEPSCTIGDSTQLQNAILNIAINARDAMPDGGKIVFTTEVVSAHSLSPELLPPGEDSSDYIRLAIADTGIGMAEETRKRIFEPFFTTKSADKGTGMGLPSAYGVVENHGGAICVDSSPAEGTVFTVYLPLTEDTAPDTHSELPIHGTASVLVIDDEKDVRSFVTIVLKKLGYQVTACSGGREALELYQKKWREIDLVILDMVMPEMDGSQTFAHMQEINPDVRAILASGYSANNKARETLARGALDFISKPFDIADLSKRIAQALHS